MAKRVLCIGINNYPGTDMDLRGCVNDAQDWAKVFLERGFSVQFLLDKQATGRAIKEGISKLVDSSRSEDIVAIQYSGHGSFIPDEDGDEPDGKDECLCPYDIKSNGPITDDYLRDIFRGKKKGVKIVIFCDSCNSGTITKHSIEPLFSNKDNNNFTNRKKFMPPDVFLSNTEMCRFGFHVRSMKTKDSPEKYWALLLSGCQEDEYCIDGNFNGRPNGVFTVVALKTISKVSFKSTYIDWYREIRKILPSKQYPQTPNLYGSNIMKRWNIL